MPIAELPAGARANAIAEISAACIGMGELWLRVLGVPRTDCSFEWSLFTYATGAVGTLAPVARAELCPPYESGEA